MTISELNFKMNLILILIGPDEIELEMTVFFPDLKYIDEIVQALTELFTLLVVIPLKKSFECQNWSNWAPLSTYEKYSCVQCNFPDGNSILAYNQFIPISQN